MEKKGIDELSPLYPRDFDSFVKCQAASPNEADSRSRPIARSSLPVKRIRVFFSFPLALIAPISNMQ